MKGKILITGATGNLGGLVIDALLSKIEANQIAGLVRDTNKAEALQAKGIDIREGNYDDESSLEKAFSGVEKIYFISGNDLDKRVDQHKNIVAAAEKAGVEHVVYTSFGRKDESENSPIYPVAKGHLAAEDALKNASLDYTILKHNLYMEVIPLFAGENLLESKTLFLPAEDGKTGFMARKDMAVLAAEILTGEGHENKTYEVSAEKAFTFAEIAALISEVSGTEINYVSPNPEEFAKTLKGYGVPQPAIDMTVMFAKGIAQGEFDETATTYRDFTGNEPTSLKTFLADTYGK
ncbi:SDR family oxidoreductase [Mesonia sp.]|uniref:SDR family oxidoreductase n=1 Tax=Mesonia sp. TaxID=1960830 RepID=UPI00176B333B|nr:SDR family oxidoreductase [Mesonia sp.]HIB36386.1 SDR family oxidoreductase [Mesonia sp.]HIO28055.1 SDR family oxidoreductase [Flavobacteriaceae bacterium]